MPLVEPESKGEKVLAKWEPSKAYPCPPPVEIVDGEVPITHLFLSIYSECDANPCGCQLCHRWAKGSHKFLRLKLNLTGVADIHAPLSDLPEPRGREEFVICDECMERIVQLWNSVQPE